MASRAALVVLVVGSLFAAGAPADPEEVIRWQFAYTGPRVTARGIVETAAIPEEDGSYRILAVTGRSNGKRIVELLPAGEMLTSLEQFMFADNRLLPASPYFSEGGFTYRTSDSNYYNLCHAGGIGNCGADGYREFDGKKGDREVRFELTRISDPTQVTAPPITEASAANPG